MPEKWVAPELFLRYRGVNIWHVYYRDVYGDRRQYIYGNSIYCSDDGDYTFDVRDLPVPDGVSPDDHATIIRAAIDAGDPRVIGEQEVLEFDVPENTCFAIFGFYDHAYGDSFVDIVCAHTQEEAVAKVCRERGEEAIPILAMSKNELVALLEEM